MVFTHNPQSIHASLGLISVITLSFCTMHICIKWRSHSDSNYVGGITPTYTFENWKKSL